MEKKYLVTGGAGFIGSHLSETLSLTGNQIIIVDDLSSGFRKNIQFNENTFFRNSGIQDIDASELKGIDGIFHLAAQASVPKSIEEFYASSSNNLLGTLKVFDISRILKIPVVYASSSAVYGNLELGNDEVPEFDIISPYAQDKLAMEFYAKMAWNVYKTSSIGLRFFNVYGPRQDPKNPYSGVISIFMDRMLNHLPVRLNGGYQTRDFIFVKNIVDVLMGSMEYLHKNQICETFNVGTGKSISVSQLLEILKKILKAEPVVNIHDLPAGDPERSEGTYNKLEKILGISPGEFIGIDEGLFQTIQYLNKTN